MRNRLGIGICTAVATVTLTAFGVGGCATRSKQGTVVKPRLETQVSTYEMNYDEAPLPLAVRLYMMDHNGQKPRKMVDLLKYREVCADVNKNGVLDNQRIAQVYKRGGQAFEVRIKETTRPEATESGKPEVDKYRFVLNKDGSITIWQSSLKSYKDAAKGFDNILKRVNRVFKQYNKATKAYKRFEKQALKKPKKKEDKKPKTK